MSTYNSFDDIPDNESKNRNKNVLRTHNLTEGQCCLNMAMMLSCACCCYMDYIGNLIPA